MQYYLEPYLCPVWSDIHINFDWIYDYFWMRIILYVYIIGFRIEPGIDTVAIFPVDLFKNPETGTVQYLELVTFRNDPSFRLYAGVLEGNQVKKQVCIYDF